MTEAAAYLRLVESEVVGLAHTQGLPGRNVDGEWRFLKAALQHWLATGSPTWDTRKAAILELSGKYKDDPDLENIVERRLPPTRLAGHPRRPPVSKGNDYTVKGEWMFILDTDTLSHLLHFSPFSTWAVEPFRRRRLFVHLLLKEH